MNLFLVYLAFQVHFSIAFTLIVYVSAHESQFGDIQDNNVAASHTFDDESGYSYKVPSARLSIDPQLQIQPQFQPQFQPQIQPSEPQPEFQLQQQPQPQPNFQPKQQHQCLPGQQGKYPNCFNPASSPEAALQQQLHSSHAECATGEQGQYPNCYRLQAPLAAPPPQTLPASQPQPRCPLGQQGEFPNCFFPQAPTSSEAASVASHTYDDDNGYNYNIPYTKF